MLPFRPDARLPVAVVPSPNHGERAGFVDILLLHYTGMRDAQAALDRLCSAEAKVSAHYLVFEDGRTVQLVPEARRAWHAGEAYWAGETDINSRSIGIEIANPGHEFGYPEFPRGQIETVIALCGDIVRRCRIPAERVLAHSDVAPARKQDPGERFPWNALYAAGVGRWVEPTLAACEDGALSTGMRGPDIRAMQTDLRRYGYGVPHSGSFDDATAGVVRAFQRHFRPARIDGVFDGSTRATLAALLALNQPHDPV